MQYNISVYPAKTTSSIPELYKRQKVFRPILVVFSSHFYFVKFLKHNVYLLRNCPFCLKISKTCYILISDSLILLQFMDSTNVALSIVNNVFFLVTTLSINRKTVPITSIFQKNLHVWTFPQYYYNMPTWIFVT